MGRLRRFAIGWSILAVSLAACGGATSTSSPLGGSGSAPPSVTDSPPTSATPEPTPGTEIRFVDPDPATGAPKNGGTLRYLMRDEPVILDPHKSNVFPNRLATDTMYETLIEPVNYELKPLLARSWSVSDDGLTVTLELQPNAKFHSGRPVTAEAVKYSLERVMNPDTGSPRRGNLAAIAEIRTPQATRVEIVLKSPSASFLANLAAWQVAILDPDVVEANGGNIDRVDAGTGPYVLKVWESGRQLVVERNPDYWQAGMPYLDAIVFTFNSDDNARSAALRSGAVDMITNLDPAFLESVKADPTFKWYGGSSGTWSSVTLNVQREPFNDVRVRQALFLAIDRQEVMDFANNGLGEVLTGGFLSPSKWGALDEPIYGKPDIVKAKNLLKEAGYPDGFSTTIKFNGQASFHTRAMQVIQQQLKAIGVNAELLPLDPSVLQAQSREGDFDMASFGNAGSVDPDERITATYLGGGGQNRCDFSDPRIEKLALDARLETDRDARERIYQEIMRLLATEGPEIYTYNWADFVGAAKRVEGFRWDPLQGQKSLRGVWLNG